MCGNGSERPRLCGDGSLVFIDFIECKELLNLRLSFVCGDVERRFSLLYMVFSYRTSLILFSESFSDYLWVIK